MAKPSPFLRAALILALSLSSLPPRAEGTRSLRFGGFVWDFKKSLEPMNPGPNLWGDGADQAWVDQDGRLHLSIVKREEAWSSVELIESKRLGYGTFSVDVDSSIRNLDPNAIFGFFTWDQISGRYSRELDIEVSRWGNPESLPGWFTVQPYEIRENQHGFDLPPAKSYTFWMGWSKEAIVFSCFADGVPVTTWTWSGKVPTPGAARLHLNLWLFQGREPAGFGATEVILSNLRYTPAPR
jgi:hypothetical protein